MNDVKEIYATIDGFVKIKDEKDLPLLTHEAKFLSKRGFRSICLGVLKNDEWILPNFDFESKEYLDFLKVPIKKSILVESGYLIGNGDLLYHMKVDEIDVRLPYWFIKQFNYDGLDSSLWKIKNRFGEYTLKGIIEVPLLNGREIMWATDMIAKYDWNFVKTGTGRFGITLPRHIMLMCSQLSRSDPSGKVKIKAAGGLRGMRGWLMAIESGADVVGMSGYRELVKEAESSG